MCARHPNISILGHWALENIGGMPVDFNHCIWEYANIRVPLWASGICGFCVFFVGKIIKSFKRKKITMDVVENGRLVHLASLVSLFSVDVSRQGIWIKSAKNNSFVKN